jgi:hypothetical protein
LRPILAASNVRCSRPKPSGDFLLARSPTAGILEPGERHSDILGDLVRSGQVTGPLVMDAVLAAIALEPGATDRGFWRFSGLKWTNPLAQSR